MQKGKAHRPLVLHPRDVTDERLVEDRIHGRTIETTALGQALHPATFGVAKGIGHGELR